MLPNTLSHRERRLTRTPVLNAGDAEFKRREMRDYFHHTFTHNESLFDCLAGDEAFYARANRLRHPLIFYYGHTMVFFINKLNVVNLVDARIEPRLVSLMAGGVDEMSWDDLNDDHCDWPTRVQVKAYRDKTRDVVDLFVRQCGLSMPIDIPSVISRDCAQVPIRRF